MYDLIIIGGGPAGVAAGIYAARKKISTAIVAQEFGGQSIVSADVQNWIGTPSISGYDLAEQLKKHLFEHKEGIDVFEGDLVNRIEPHFAEASRDKLREASDERGGFKVFLKSGKELETKNIFVASGSRRRRLDIPGEDKFEGKGVVYCSICDAPLFRDKVVVVVGGGNAGLEAVIDLLPYAKKTYLMVRSDAPKGDAVTLQKVMSHPNVEIITNALAKEINGEGFVSSLTYLDQKTNETKELPVEGVFVEIGAVPNSEFLKGLVELNERGEVMVDHKTQASSAPGIWAAGDVSDVLYKQNNISAGDAIKAVLNIYEMMVKGK